MANLDEIPRGQLSTIILTCLSSQDKYGYEIIDEVLKKTNGRMSIKQPSLYSSLKRMEEQSLISSYWRESDIGGRRHYYHLTDLGKKHLEKWQDSLPENFLNDNVSFSQEQTKVLQQENLFNLAESNNNVDVKPESKVEEKQIDNSYVQYDLFSNSVIITPPAQEAIQIEPIEQVSKITTNSTLVENKDINEGQLIFKDFDFVKKSNRSFADKVKTINTIEEKKYVDNKQVLLVSNEQQNEVVDEIKTTVPLISDCNEDKVYVPSNDIQENEETQFVNNNIVNNVDLYESPLNQHENFIESFKEETILVDEYVGNSQNNDDTLNYIKAEEESKAEDTDKTIENEHTQTSNINFEKIQGYIPRPKQEKPEINQEEKPEEVKDDGVFITDRLNPEDMPKPYKWDSRRFEVYISDNSITPYIDNKTSNYEDRVKELYEKSKNSSDNQKIEIVDNIIKFSSYQELQEFYANQNIKFKPYQKKLKKTERDYDMIKINKFNMLTSLSLFLVIATLSLVAGIIFSFAESPYLNSPITFVIYPATILIFFITRLYTYLKSPQKRIAYDINKYKLNFGLSIISILLIPIIFAINLIAGFSFELSDIIKYSITVSVPCLIAITYFIYHFIQRIILKFKTIY